MGANAMTGKVLDMLGTCGLLTGEQLASVCESAAADGKNPGVVVLERGLVTAGDIATVLEGEMGVPRVDLSSYAPETSALALVPAEVARARRVLPLFEIEGMLTVAIGEATDVFTLDDVSREIGVELEPVLADSASVIGAIAQYYDAREAPAQGPAAEAESPPAATAEELEIPEARAAEAPAELSPFEPAASQAVEQAPAAEGPEAEELVIDAGDLFEIPAEAAPPPPVAEEGSFVVPVLGGEFLGEEGTADESEPGVPVVPPAPSEPAAKEPEPAAETIDRVAAAEAPAGPPAVDLDVLAVADAGKVAVLVAEILELAVRRDATRIHLLPYKDDFFLVYRVGGRLEKVASAPLSMQASLVEGFKSFAKLGSQSSHLPALGRLHARLADKDLVVTLSTVPTVAGQRMVVSLSSAKPEPRGLPDLGMSEAETRALHAMVERGRGLLLVCAPVAGGSSSTYYALLAHAARVGKTAYSVERSVEYELPAVAQVLVNPGSPVGAASYFAAGMRQDTDVIAIDSLQSVEEVHLAIEAAGLGKLVIATHAAGDIVSGVRRMLDLGAEPNSLASALTLGIGQRLVRTNCPSCAVEEDGDAAARIPGAPATLRSHAGAGCAACAKTGFAGATGVFEVLPFTEPVRTAIARGATAEEMAAAAIAAGMRTLAASGLAKVADGVVSARELDRVLRFT